MMFMYVLEGDSPCRGPVLAVQYPPLGHAGVHLTIDPTMILDIPHQPFECIPLMSSCVLLFVLLFPPPEVLPRNPHSYSATVI